ncbi:MAG: hypothetical protein KC431_11905, partial [Myxococcales bacterium]|nr:hypothetical protein [Myxococcales bacterium]
GESETVSSWAWSLPALQALPAPAGGQPLFSANGAWAASVSPSQRILVGRTEVAPTRVVAHQSAAADEDAVAALADDGTLAVVQPFAGGVLELIGADEAVAPVSVELPGAATALAWISTVDGGAQTLLIGFDDGSIARLDLGGQPLLLDPGEGGRVWALAGVRPGSYIELDDEYLTLHRLGDDATVRIHVADTTALHRHAASPVQPLRSEDLVAVWTPGTAMPACRVLDGSAAGVLLPPEIERWEPARAGEFFAAFFAGDPCAGTAPAVPDESPAPALPTVQHPHKQSSEPSAPEPSAPEPPLEKK